MNDKASKSPLPRALTARLRAIAGFIILVSRLIHGMTPAPLLQRLTRRRKAETNAG